MKITRFEAKLIVCLLYFMWLLVSSCGAVKKVLHKEETKKDSTSTSQVITVKEKSLVIDSSVAVEITDSSVIETEYERTVTAEDYFVTLDSTTVLKNGTIVRKTVTTEKGKVREQKAVEEKKQSTYSEALQEKAASDSSGTTTSNEEKSITDKTVDKKEWKLFSFTNICWLIFIILFLVVARKYLWPAFKGMFSVPPAG